MEVFPSLIVFLKLLVFSVLAVVAELELALFSMQRPSTLAWDAC